MNSGNKLGQFVVEGAVFALRFLTVVAKASPSLQGMWEGALQRSHARKFG
jgi:hypothetical protein